MTDYFNPILSPWPWIVAGLALPAIVALYFLKLRRKPVEVPSTYLWSRTIEDLHVNSFWQRLRQSLLLFLQLLVILLVLFAFLRPGVMGTKLLESRVIILLDNSASMSAQDVSPSRLDAAKDRALEIVEKLGPSDVAMVIAYSDEAQVVQEYTDNRSLLRQKIQAVEPTQRPSRLDEALRAASGLANPGRSSADETDVQTAEAKPAELFIVSDGGVAAVPDFAVGNLNPKFLQVGSEEASNVGILAFSAERNVEKPQQFQVYGRLGNYSLEERSVEASLYLDDLLIDARRTTIPPGEEGDVVFDMDLTDGRPPEGTLRLTIAPEGQDDLELDNVAYAALNPARKARVLFVTPGNGPWELALTTDAVAEIADVEIGAPALLETKEHQLAADEGRYDLILYDRVSPVRPPQANAFYIASLPPGEQWSAGELEGPPILVDSDRAHPVMYLIEALSNIAIAEARTIEGPQGARTLLEADIGPVMQVAPRGGFEDVVLGFSFYDQGDGGETLVNTDWPRKLSFPIFVQNVVGYLGGSRGALVANSVRPGESTTVRVDVPADRIEVVNPAGDVTPIERRGEATFIYPFTERTGVYGVRLPGKEIQRRFAVNLFDPRESDLAPAELKIGGGEALAASADWTPARNEWWKWVVLACLGLVIFEWWVYNRRVYL